MALVTFNTIWMPATMVKPEELAEIQTNRENGDVAQTVFVRI
jgi:hypothetical protein